MFDLLRIEWLKYKHYKTFWFLILAFFGFLTLFYCAVSFGWISINPGGLSVVGKASSFSRLWSDLCFFASYFVIILSILIIIINSNEMQFRTNRQNIIDGWTRIQFFHLKWMLILGLSLATTLFVVVLGTLTGWYSGLSFIFYFHQFEKILWLFLLCMNYLGFAFFLSVYLKKSGLAIGILMFYSLMVEMILHSLFLFKYRFPAGDFFLPLQASDELLPSGTLQMIKMSLKAKYNPEEWAFALATVTWIIIYYLLTRRKTLKRDW